MSSNKQRLKDLFRPGRCLVIPGVFDLISARVARQCGFEALYMTGYGTVASSLGLPDAGIATYTDMVDRVRKLTDNVDLPLVADGDTGYGGLLNVHYTVRGYESAGAAAIQIEDQEHPKKCGHTDGRRVIATEEMVRKIRVATEARASDDFLIVARTDARTGLGLDEALRRGEAYLSAGADVLFIESPESREELELIGHTFDAPLMVNMVEGGKTPMLSRDELAELGFAVAIFPALGYLAAAAAVHAAFATLKERGLSLPSSVPLYDFAAFNTLMGFPDVWEFEARHGGA